VRSVNKVIFNFSSPLHVSVQTDHLQKEHGPFGPKHVKDLEKLNITLLIDRTGRSL
jgi:hypothetical protein